MGAHGFEHLCGIIDSYTIIITILGNVLFQFSFKNKTSFGLTYKKNINI